MLTVAVGGLVVATVTAKAAAAREKAPTKAAKEAVPVVGLEVVAMERRTAMPEDGVAATGVVVKLEVAREMTEKRVG